LNNEEGERIQSNREINIITIFYNREQKMKRALAIFLTVTTVLASPATIEDGELVPATSGSMAPIDPTTAPRPDVTQFLRKCRKKCDNLDNLPSYMDNHATSEEHCYLGCHWGFEMLCQEIGCQNGIKLNTPKPAEPISAPMPIEAASGATGGSSATGSDSTGSASITGGMSDDEVEHIKSVEGVMNGWSTTGGTGAATGSEEDATGSGSTGGGSTGGTGGGATGGSTGGQFIEVETSRSSLLLGRNRNSRKFN